MIEVRYEWSDVSGWERVEGGESAGKADERVSQAAEARETWLYGSEIKRPVSLAGRPPHRLSFGL
jgi:hypothetical protein